MAIRPRGSAWQCSLTHNGRRFRKDFPTRAEAEAWEAALSASLQATGTAPTEGLNIAPVTLEELFERTKTRYWEGQKSASILIMNGRMMVDLIGPLTPIKAIGPAQIDAATLALKQGTKNYSGATINRKLAALSKMLTYAAKMEWITKRPNFEWEDEPEGRLRWFTEEEEERILAWFTFTGEPEMRDFVSLLVDTGMRVSEGLNLTAGEVERVLLVGGGERLQIRLFASRTKSNRSRVIPATERATEILRRRMRGTKAKLFTGLSKKGIEESWNRCRAHMGMLGDEEFVPHTLRHTFASRLVQRGVPLYEVQKLLGHSTMTLTMRYAKLAPASLVDAVAVLDRSNARAQATTCAPEAGTARMEGAQTDAVI